MIKRMSERKETCFHVYLLNVWFIQENNYNHRLGKRHLKYKKK